MDAITESVQNIDRNHELRKDHGRDDEGDEAVNPRPRVVNLNPMRFVAGFV